VRHTVSIPAPDEATANDLASGGLFVFRPAVFHGGGKWRVELRVRREELELVSRMVEYWLRRSGLAEVEVVLSDVPSTVRVAQRGVTRERRAS
jgi:hypothetical protein